jgi:uncharacterized protein YjdB
MKNTFKNIGIILLIAVLGFALASCPNEEYDRLINEKKEGEGAGSGTTPGGGGGNPGSGNIAVTKVSLNKSATVMLTGSKETLTATITPTNATNKTVTWSTSNTAIATVSGGEITAVAKGTAVITATTADGGKTATCSVTVSDTAVAVTGVSLNKSSTTIIAGETETLTATITPSGATNQNVTWSSSNTAVATVSGGTVTAKATGTATITVTTADGNKNATCAVTVTSLTISVTIRGTLGVGNVLQADVQKNFAGTDRYQWMIGGSPIPGETYSEYEPQPTDAGKKISVRVTSGEGANVKTATSPEVTIPTFTYTVGLGNWQNTYWAYVKIGEGEYPPTAENGFSVQWLRNGTAISGATDPNYELQTADAGKTLKAKVSGYSQTVYSADINVPDTSGGGGEGNTSDFTYTEANGVITITGYIGAGGSVSIPTQINGKPVTSIGESAFYDCTSLTSITIPNSVTSIRGLWTFSGCTSLTAINVASDNTAFTSENGVLYNKNKTLLIQYPAGKTASSFTIPNTVTIIDYHAFYKCTSLTSITIPDSVTSILGIFPFGGAFSNCTNLTSVTIGNSVTSIGEMAFVSCTSLASVTIGNSVTFIRENAFSGCTSLTSVTIPASVTSIENSAFAGCKNLTSVTFATGSNISDDYFNFGWSVFPEGSDGRGGDTLKTAYSTGKAGTYTRPANGSTWTKSDGGGAPSDTYIITGSGTSFTATKDGATIRSGAIQNVIDAIRTHAAGTNPTIQFGNDNVLDIGAETVKLYNLSNSSWGAITLTGKITSKAYMYTTSATIYISGPVSVTSRADIENSNTNTNANALRNTGNLTISGGTVTANGNGTAVCNTADGASGTVNITGGTVTANDNGKAVYNDNGGIVNISGGTVTAPSGRAVFCCASTVNISGGTVSTTTGTAVHGVDDEYGQYYSTINISGGTVSATSGTAVINEFSRVNITGGTISTISGRAVYIWASGGRGGQLLSVSGTAKITSANTNDKQGTIHLRITSSYRIEITGGTVENTSTTTGNAIYNGGGSGGSGSVSITGGTVSKAGSGDYAVYKDGTGEVTIGAGATIVGNNYGF